MDFLFQFFCIYLIISEILAIKVKTNKDVMGSYKLLICEQKQNNLQHGDDGTLAPRDILSLDKSFCDHAGSKVNLDKTRYTLLGKFND